MGPDAVILVLFFFKDLVLSWLFHSPPSPSSRGYTILYKGLASLRASRVAQLVKNLPTMQEIWICFLGQEDPLEKG